MPSQWRHVTSQLNPADEVSRGLRMDKLLSSSRWLTGPEFIWKDADQWPVSLVETTGTLDLELRKEAKAYVTDVQQPVNAVLQLLFDRHSSWYSLKKSAACLLRVKAFPNVLFFVIW